MILFSTASYTWWPHQENTSGPGSPARRRWWGPAVCAPAAVWW